MDRNAILKNDLEESQTTNRIDALALTGIHSPNADLIDRVNTQVHEGREHIAASSVSLDPSIEYTFPHDLRPRGVYEGSTIELSQHRYTGGLVRSDDYYLFDAQLRPISREEALAEVVNYGPSGGTLEKVPIVESEVISSPALTRAAINAGSEEWLSDTKSNERADWRRTAPEQNPSTALSVEAAFPEGHIAPNYEKALERWEAAVHLHEDLRGRPLTPQEYRQQIEINGPRWTHDVVVAQPVDGTQNLYDRPYTQITPTDHTLSPAAYERVLEQHGPDWQHSVVLREPFPLDPDSRFLEAHNDWLEHNKQSRQDYGGPISPQAYQTHREAGEWHEDSRVIVTPPLQPEDEVASSRSQVRQLPSVTHDEYRELLERNGPGWQHSVVVLEPTQEHFGMDLPTSWRNDPRVEHDYALADHRVASYATSEWSVESGGGWEHRIHLGRSADGYHFAVERNFNGGDTNDGGLAWSTPLASHGDASQAAHRAVAQILSHETEHGNGFSM